jgi:hypothetical protein
MSTGKIYCHRQTPMLRLETIMRLHRISILICVALVVGGIRAQEQASGPSPAALAGDWEGTVAGRVPLVLHLHADASGALTATLDSPAQGANGLAVASVKLDGSAFSFAVPSVNGSYTGAIGAGGRSISGTWTQGQSTPLDWKQTKTAAQVATDEASLKPSAVDGDWKGALSAGGQTLHILFHFHTIAGGAIRCAMDSLDQGAMGIPCGDAQLDGKKVSVNAPAIHGTYEGNLRADGKHIDGTWSQGSPLELDLTKQ